VGCVADSGVGEVEGDGAGGDGEMRRGRVDFLGGVGDVVQREGGVLRAFGVLRGLRAVVDGGGGGGDEEEGQEGE